MPVVRVAVGSGSITVVAEDRQDVVVTKGGEARFDEDGCVEVEARRSSSVAVRCPPGTDVVAGTGSGSVHLSGPLGDVRVTSGSGSIDVEKARSADLRTRSGRIAVGRVEGTVRGATSSGSIAVAAAEAVEATSRSGRVEVAAHQVLVRVVSGRVVVHSTGEDADVSVDTVSGNVTVEAPPEVHPRVRTVHGKVTVRPA